MKAMIGILMIMSVITAFCIGPASSQNVTAENVMAENAMAENVMAENVMTENVTADNVTADNVTAENVTTESITAENVMAESVTAENGAITVPVEQVSRFMQLSKGAPAGFASLSKNIAGGYMDVTQAADTSSVFAREPGVPIPSVKVSITKVNVIGERWVEVTNQAVGSWDLTGWKLISAGSATYTFPQLVLNSTASVKAHEGTGTDSKTDLYAAGTLWTDNVIQLQDATGRTISSYDVTTAPTQAPKWVDPLAASIQY